MNLQQLHNNFSISEQISLEDIATLAASGVTTIICNRPDGEEPNQITCLEIKTTAEANGINFVHIPVPGRDIPAEALEKFINIISENDSKIHAYCRTGTRSSIFWQLSQQ